MNDYFVRCVESDVPALYALAGALGVLQPVPDTDAHTVAPPHSGAWDVVGPIYRPTGEMLDVGGIESPVTAPICSPDGQPYWHANLRIDASLMDLAQASDDPAVQAGLGDLARWFVVGADGMATAPQQPARVWL